MSSHLWYLVWEDEVCEQFNALSRSEQLGLFSKMAELLSAEDPYLVLGVEPYQEKRFGDSRKIRKGNYRMQFRAEPGEITVNKFKYKGKLIIISIKNRRDAYR